MLKCGARFAGPAAGFLALALLMSSAAYGETVIRRGQFQSKMGTEDPKTCGDFVWLISDENGNGRKDPGEKWIFRVENCPEIAAVLDMGNPDPDPACGDGHADAGETCGEPGLSSCQSGYRCNASCSCEVIPNPGDPTGKCKDGTPDKNQVGNYVVDNIAVPQGQVVSYCFPVPAGTVNVSADTRNRASVTCGNTTLLLRHSDTTLYPNVKAQDSGSSPSATLTTLGGTCGYFPPGCPAKVPAGTYEVRLTGNSNECSNVALAIGVH